MLERNRQIETRAVEMEYLNRNTELIQKVYEDKWIVLSGEVIVSSDKSLAKAVKRAREIGIEIPFAHWVESANEPPFAL